MLISPSMLASDYCMLGSEVERLEKNGADWVHLDIMDGHFVPNISFGPGVVKSLRPHSTLPFDVHLMLTHPLAYIDAFADAGADILTFHVECADDIDAVLTRIEGRGVKPGLVLKPGTPYTAVLPYLSRLFMVLVMTVEPGFGGQSFMPEMLAKVRALKAAAPGVLLQVDGGVSAQNAGDCLQAGVDVCVAGSSVFHAKEMQKAIESIRSPGNVG